MHPSVHQQYDIPMNDEISFDNDGGNLPPNTNAPVTMMSPEEIAEGKNFLQEFSSGIKKKHILVP